MGTSGNLTQVHWMMLTIKPWLLCNRAATEILIPKSLFGILSITSAVKIQNGDYQAK